MAEKQIVALKSNTLQYREDLDTSLEHAGGEPDSIFRLMEACHPGAGTDVTIGPAHIELHCSHCDKLVIAVSVLFADGQVEQLSSLKPPFDSMYQSGKLNVRDRKTGTIMAVEVEKRKNE